jgi:hypothetical protein
MKHCLIMFGAIGFALAQQPTGQMLAVPDGTAVHVQLKKEMSSQTIQRGDTIEFEVAEPVLIEETAVIAKGATATAKIEESKSAGHFGRRGRLAWAMESVTAVDGTRIALRFVKEPAQGGSGVKGRTKAGAAAETTVLAGAMLYYWPVAVVSLPFAAANKGKPEVIPAGERYLVFVNGDISLPAVSHPGSKPETAP